MTQDLTFLKVLLVEDNPSLSYILTEYLRSLGVMNLTPAMDGMEALKKLDEAPQGFDIIISDLRMPRMDGMELVRHLGDRHFHGGLILLTGEGAQRKDDFLNSALRCGLKVLAALEKPIQGESLKEALNGPSNNPPA